MLAFGFPGGWEWFVILLVALLIFGNRLPAVMRSLGRSMTEFKKGLKEGEDEKSPVLGDDEDEGDSADHPAPPAG